MPVVAGMSEPTERRASEDAFFRDHPRWPLTADGERSSPAPTSRRSASSNLRP